MLQIFNYNAGKGDCLRLRYTGASGIPHNILIDSGVIRFGLEFEAICKQIVANHEKIDVIILSHVDTDHLGGLLYNLRNKTKLNIEEVWMNHGKLMGKNTDLSVRQNDEVYTALKEQGITIKPALAGMTYDLDGAVFRILWPNEETLYSPIDKVSESDEGIIVHSIDAAVICLEIKEEISFETTDYVIGEVHKGDGVLAQGFPGSETEIEELLNYVEGTYGRILHNAKDKEVLLWQIEDTHVDSGNRVYELNGFSGSPVWSLEADEKTIVGLFTSGVGRSIYRGKVHALKMEAI